MALPAPAISIASAASALPGPFPVGVYAERLRDRLRDLARVQIAGEVCGLRIARARVYFELRDERGALPCSMWRSDLEALGIPLADGLRVVAGGGCDLYPGSRHASPSFSFAVTELRIEGEGDLLVALEHLRRRLAADGLLEPQKRLARPALPRTIAVVTGETGKARDDVLAGLHRRGWGGRLVWAFVPVQDRRAAPQIAAALRDLAASGLPEVIIVARGGGSLADLLAFCDEALCRTVALLPVPVIASVGHHTDRPLIDDVAALACSTPTHAAEAAVPVAPSLARAELAAAAQRLAAQGQRAVRSRAAVLGHLARAPQHHLDRHRAALGRLARGLSDGGARANAAHRRTTETSARELERAGRRAQGAESAGRRRDLDRLLLALDAHDPARTLARGYAIVESAEGEPVSAAAEAAAAGRVNLRFADGAVGATVDPAASGR